MTPAEMVRNYSLLVEKLCSVFPEDAREDATQEVWTRLLASDLLKKYNPERGPFEHYFYVAAFNAMITVRRTFWHHKRADAEIQEVLKLGEDGLTFLDEEGVILPTFTGTEKRQDQQAHVFSLLSAAGPRRKLRPVPAGPHSLCVG